MNGMKKRFLALLLALLMLAALAGCGGGSGGQDAGGSSAGSAGSAGDAGGDTGGEPAEGGLKIGACVMDLTAEYFSESVKGYNEWISQHPENTLTVVDGQGDVRRQIEAVENFITAGMDCILINSLDIEATVDVVKRAVDAGIKVMQYPDADYVTVGLCNDDYNFGYIQGTEAAKWINEKLGGEATVMFIWAPSNPALLSRYEGQKQALLDNCDESKLTLLDPQSANTSSDATTVAENILAAHPETRVCIAEGDSKACAVAEVIKAKGLDTSEWFLTGVDGTEEALNKIKDGTYGYRCSVAYSLRTPDIAYDLIDNIARAARGEDYAAKYYQDVLAVTADNIDEYTEMQPTFTDRFQDYYNYWLEKDGAK